jgi:hypothetical protein
MTALELSKAWVYPDEPDTSGAYSFSPKAPGIAADANGRPQLNLMTAGSVAFLQVTGCWGLNAGELEETRRELGRKLGRRPEDLTLRPAPDRVEGVALVLGGEGGEQVLARSKSSGMSPFHAAFNVTLDEAQLGAVKAAMDGEKGRLGIVYEVTREVPGARLTSAQASQTEVHVGGGQGGDWSSASRHAGSATTRAASPEVEKISSRLDAADWGAGR